VKSKKAQYTKTLGAKFCPGVHDLIVSISRLADLGVGEAYQEALVDWLRRQATHDSIAKNIIDRKCSEDADLRAVMNTKPARSHKSLSSL
jgi:hypothetical protein